MKSISCTTIVALAFVTLLAGCDSSNGGLSPPPPPPPPPPLAAAEWDQGNWDEVNWQ